MRTQCVPGPFSSSPSKGLGTRLIQIEPTAPSGDYSVNCGYYEISGYVVINLS